jgi:hypothetical protein
MDLLKKIRKELNVILREVKSQIIDVHIARRDIMWTIKVNDPVWQKTIADNIKKCEGVNMAEYWANVGREQEAARHFELYNWEDKWRAEQLLKEEFEKLDWSRRECGLASCVKRMRLKK